MFGNTSEGPQQSQPKPLQFPELRTYSVLNGEYEWEQYDGHHASIDSVGNLMIAIGVFVNEDCTQPGAEPAMAFAKGEWRRLKTDYRGFTRSALAI